MGENATPVFPFDSQFRRGLISGTPMRAQCEYPLSIRSVSTLALVLLLSCCFAPPARAGFPHREGLHKEIESLELEWRQALLSDDLPAIENLLADDYLGISANGTLETKDDVLAAKRSGSLKITAMSLSDIKVRIYGDTAVVTSRVQLTGKNGDHEISGRYRYTRVYSNRHGQWKIVSFEASRVPG